MTSVNGRWQTAVFFIAFALISTQLVSGVSIEDEAEKKFEAKLAELKGSNLGEKSRLKAEPLEKSFDGWSFFLLRHRVYPVAVVPQAPLKTNNIFAVSDGKVVMITSEKELEKFFKDNLGPTKSNDTILQATKSWLRIAQELHHDGFFKFKDSAVELTDSSCTGSVEVVEQKGDKGKLTVTLDFVDGKFKKATNGGKLSPGVRPKCQATRLLHEDPVIRAIMRRDILVMGSDCKSYLDEIRANASPDLQAAINDVWQQILAEGR